MLQQIYAIRDNCTQAFMKPFFVQNQSVMERALIDAKQDENSTLSMHPEDYAVYHLGTYDDQTGTIESNPATHVHNLIDLSGDK